jgi:hypothetical protein
MGAASPLDARVRREALGATDVAVVAHADDGLLISIDPEP